MVPTRLWLRSDHVGAISKIINLTKGENMSLNSISLPHTCPKCKIVAHNRDELEKLFGLRQMNEKSIREQSWCKKCRSKYSKTN